MSEPENPEQPEALIRAPANSLRPGSSNLARRAIEEINRLDARLGTSEETTLQTLTAFVNLPLGLEAVSCAALAKVAEYCFPRHEIMVSADCPDFNSPSFFTARPTPRVRKTAPANAIRDTMGQMGHIIPFGTEITFTARLSQIEFEELRSILFALPWLVRQDDGGIWAIAEFKNDRPGLIRALTNLPREPNQYLFSRDLPDMQREAGRVVGRRSPLGHPPGYYLRNENCHPEEVLASLEQALAEDLSLDDRFKFSHWAGLPANEWTNRHRSLLGLVMRHCFVVSTPDVVYDNLAVFKHVCEHCTEAKLPPLDTPPITDVIDITDIFTRLFHGEVH